jgi:eukaryotic translation initiation factor 2C
VQFIERPHTLVDEDSQSRRCSPVERVEKMFEKVKTSLPGPPEFLLCVLPERKNCDIYGNTIYSYCFYATMYPLCN